MSTIEFNQELVSHSRALEYFAISLCSNREDARDLLQDTFLKAISYREKFRDATNLKAWLYTIMKNTFINSYRRSKKTRVLIDQREDLSHLNNALESRDRNPLVMLGIKEITASVETLQDEYRVPFQMHNSGYKYQDIADHLHLPIGTVKSRIFLARQKLAEALPGYGSN